MKNSKGFTLIELLIVIAVLGILIVAILSAIDPLEQIRKARDAGRKSDAAELLSAFERYFSTFQCYPWDNQAPDCSNITTASRDTITYPFVAPYTTDSGLIEQGELKAQFPNRDTIASSELYVSENSTTRQMTVCYVPESKSGRNGGYGDLSPTATGGTTDVTACTGTYSASTSGTCYICLPQ